MADAEKEVKAGERKLAEMDFKAALSKFRKAIRLDPDDSTAHFGKAEAGIGVPNVSSEEIIEDYERAIELEPENAFFTARLGSFSLEAGEWELAEQSYNKAAELDPENAYLYYSEFGLEYYYAWMAKYEEEATEEERKEALAKCLSYLVRSLDLTPEEAKQLL
jgi:tetratricopeptide (TPR) repeat protein